MSNGFSSRLSRLALLGAAAWFAVLLGDAHASVLWYDGFTTTPGGQYDTALPLGGQSGGAGTFFTGPYIQAGTDDQFVVPTSLTVPSQLQPSTGGAVSDTNGGTGRSGRAMAQPWQGLPANVPQGTFYIGFLANFGSGAPRHHRVFEMWNNAGLGDGNRVLQLGYSDFTGMGPTMALAVSGSPLAPLSENLAYENDGRTHCFVLRFDLSNTALSDRVRVYMDGMGLSEPAVASADVSGINFTASHVGTISHFVFGDGASVLPTFDELRVGTTYGDVALCSVPEPSTIGLLSIGLLGLVRRRR